MGIFDKIKNAIFGHASSAQPGAPARAPGSAAPTAHPTPAPGSGPTAAPAPVPGAPTSIKPTAVAPIDIEPVLDGLAAKNSQKLNWRTSIVDLMKLVGLDSSLEHRKELARELGYTGDTGDSATMNVWLHKQVMKKLAENGGKVPQSLAN